MSCFGLVLHSVGAESCLGCRGILDAKRGFAGRNIAGGLFAESCCGVVRQCKDFAIKMRNLVARSLCCAGIKSVIKPLYQTMEVKNAKN